MTTGSKLPPNPAAPGDASLEEVARLATELVEAARAFGEPSIIAPAEIAAFAAGVALAAAMRPRSSEP